MCVCVCVCMCAIATKLWTYCKHSRVSGTVLATRRCPHFLASAAICFALFSVVGGTWVPATTFLFVNFLAESPRPSTHSILSPQFNCTVLFSGFYAFACIVVRVFFFMREILWKYSFAWSQTSFVSVQSSYPWVLKLSIRATFER